MNEMTIPEKMELAGERVLTTKIIAEMYGTTEKVIRKNFERNKDHYTEGKHFYYLTGEDLKEFAHDNLTSAKARSLYLWTEKGALLHAKSLNTDKAWDVYMYLIDYYFRVQETVKAEPVAVVDAPEAPNYAVQSMFYEKLAETAIAKAKYALAKRAETQYLLAYPELAELDKLE